MLAFAAILLLAWSFVTVDGGPMDVALSPRRSPAGKPATDIFSWDPKDPPLWTIRPEDRKLFEANKTAYVERRQDNPCENKNSSARLYRQYWEKDCPAKHRLNPDGSCQGWQNYHDDCNSCCQIRTYFEWAREAPFPNSECHGFGKCGIDKKYTADVGWTFDLNGKIGEAAKKGVSGGLRGSWGTAYGRPLSIELRDGQCGYFTWVPVRKVVCGTVSSAVPKKSVFGWNYCDKGKNRGPKTLGNICGGEMWKVLDVARSKYVPDGTVIFVYTDCQTREPLPMDKQDPVYSAPGVALDTKSVQRRLRDGEQKQGPTQSRCSIAKSEGPGEVRVSISGWGFSDDKIGPKGEHLFEAIQRCAEVTVTKSQFDRHKSEAVPDGSLAQKGSYEYWKFSADVPAYTRPECVDEVLFVMGGSRRDKCI